MNKRLNIKLNQAYKSFQPNFEQEFLGDLVIFSGVNGSGKTQIIDIIRGFRDNPFAGKINRTITQDGVHVEDTLIAHKSFRDYSSIGELTEAGITNSVAAKSQIFNWYKENRLDINNQTLNNFRDTCKRAKSILIEKYGEEKFNGATITREEVREALPKDFVLFQDDIFTNRIGEIFFNYVSLVHNKQAEAGARGTRFDSTALPIPPWKELNDLFTKLNFAYRFKDSYERISDEINEQPAIYQVGESGSLDLSQKRALSDLSDGEKALISLTFAVLATEQTHPKIILLDEYDATLNPSLTNAFFVILEEFFIKKNIQVILATHSSATLSLAPEYASFYEIYKPKGDKPRILQVQRDQYEELAIANKKFYEKIENQETRYSEIERENNNLKEVIEKLKTHNTVPKIQVVTEGKNIEHIKKGLQLIENALLEKVEFVEGIKDKSGKNQLKTAFEVISNIPGEPKKLFVWDCDAEGIVEPLTETDNCKKFCFAKNEANSNINNGVENLYPNAIFTEEIYTETQERFNGGTKTTKIIDKDKVLAKIQASEDSAIFENFKPLFEKMKSLIPPQT